MFAFESSYLRHMDNGITMADRLLVKMSNICTSSSLQDMQVK